MRRVRIIAGVLALTVVTLAVVLLLPTAGEAAQRPSIHSNSARGLMAAYRYLAARGIPVASWEQPLTELPDAAGVLVIACPLAAPFSFEDAEAARGWMLRGGSLVLMSSGSPPDARELGLFLAHDLGHAPTRSKPPWRWSAWKEWRLAEQRLSELGSEARGDAKPKLVSLAGTHAVSRPARAKDLFLDEGGSSQVFELRRGKGRLVVINNSTMAGNGWIARADNASFLERLAVRLAPGGGPVLFDEWHQGVRSASAMTRSSVVTPFELLVAHGVLIYVAAVWTLSRRFGPRMQPPPPRGRRAAAALEALAELHHRSSHATAAGRRLLELALRRARRRGGAVEDLPHSFEGGVRDLQRLARRIGTLQGERRL